MDNRLTQATSKAASKAAPTAAAVGTPKPMSAFRRFERGHAVSDHQTNSSNGGENRMFTTSSSGCSQTSGDSTGSLNSFNSTGTVGAAASSSYADASKVQRAVILAHHPDLVRMLQPQQAPLAAWALAPPLPMIPPTMYASAMYAATTNPANLAPMAQLSQQQPMPAPQLFPPQLASLMKMGLSGEFLSLALAAAAGITTAIMQQPPQLDLGAADLKPPMNSPHSSVQSAFTRVAPRPPPPTHTLDPSSFFPNTTPVASSAIPIIHMPNPYYFDHTLPASSQKPSPTVPPLRPKAVARRRITGKSAAEAARNQWPSPSGASTCSASTSAGARGSAKSTGAAASAAAAAALKYSPDLYERPEGRRKRMPPLQEDKKYITVENKFAANMPADWNRQMRAAGAQVRPPPVVEDDDCQVVGVVIRRRYKNHIQMEERQAAFEYYRAKQLQANRLVEAGVREAHLKDPENMRRLIEQKPHIGSLLQTEGMSQIHARAMAAPHTDNSTAAATAAAHALHLPPQSAAVGGARFELARSEWTQGVKVKEEVDDEENGTMPSKYGDYHYQI